jgi:uncharacterized membrane protein
MIDPMTLLTILLMASVTYVTRIGGYVFLRNRTFSPRIKTVLDGAPVVSWLRSSRPIS